MSDRQRTPQRRRTTCATKVFARILANKQYNVYGALLQLAVDAPHWDNKKAICDCGWCERNRMHQSPCFAKTMAVSPMLLLGGQAHIQPTQWQIVLLFALTLPWRQQSLFTFLFSKQLCTWLYYGLLQCEGVTPMPTLLHDIHSGAARNSWRLVEDFMKYAAFIIRRSFCK